MPERLAANVVLITGASGMAAVTAVRCAGEGAGVFVISADARECESLAATITADGGSCDWATADLREEQAAHSAVEACVDRYGRIDGLFAVAGASARGRGDGPAHTATLEGFVAAYELNAVPTFTVASAVVRQMRRQEKQHAAPSSIVFMSSVLATSPAGLFATHGYAAAKGAIESLTRAMAAAYAPDGIRVNAVAPGLVATPMSQRAREDPDAVAYVIRKQPLAAGPLPPEAAADLAVFLLSAESRYITGQVVAVDGGWSVTETSP